MEAREKIETGSTGSISYCIPCLHKCWQSMKDCTLCWKVHFHCDHNSNFTKLSWKSKITNHIQCICMLGQIWLFSSMLLLANIEVKAVHIRNGIVRGTGHFSLHLQWVGCRKICRGVNKRTFCSRYDILCWEKTTWSARTWLYGCGVSAILQCRLLVRTFRRPTGYRRIKCWYFAVTSTAKSQEKPSYRGLILGCGMNKSFVWAVCQCSFCFVIYKIKAVLVAREFVRELECIRLPMAAKPLRGILVRNDYMVPSMGY